MGIIANSWKKQKGIINKQISFHWELSNVQYDYTPKQKYDQIISLDNYLVNESYYYRDAKKILNSKSPINVAFRELADNPYDDCQNEIRRCKKLIVLNLISGLDDGEKRYSTRQLIAYFFANLICLRCGLYHYQQKEIYVQEQMKFLNELSTNDNKALWSLYDEIVIAVIDYCNTFNISIFDFSKELKEELINNVYRSMPIAKVGNVEQVLGIICKMLELSAQRKKYSFSKIFKR